MQRRHLSSRSLSSFHFVARFGCPFGGLNVWDKRIPQALSSPELYVPSGRMPDRDQWHGGDIGTDRRSIVPLIDSTYCIKIEVVVLHEV